jgi:hypothetical protein
MSPPTSGRSSPPKERVKLWSRIVDHKRQWPVIKFLHELERVRWQAIKDCTDERLPPAWLIPYRAEFRDIADRQPAWAIRLYLLNCPADMVPIGVWLIGQCGARCRLFDIIEFGNHPNPVVRRHVAKALRRLEAWSRVSAMAKANPHDPRIVWYARAPLAKRPFGERLKNFAQHVDDSHAAEAVGPSRMALWLGDIEWVRRPPKGIEYIRRILRRIHRWVHGFR